MLFRFGLGNSSRVKKEMATHCSILAWKIPWTEEPGGQESMGLKRVGHDLATEQRVKGFLVDWMLSESWGDSIIRSRSTSHSSAKGLCLGFCGFQSDCHLGLL